MYVAPDAAPLRTGLIPLRPAPARPSPALPTLMPTPTPTPTLAATPTPASAPPLTPAPAAGWAGAAYRS